MQYNIFIIVLLLLNTSSVFANEKVTLQLKWYHQFQFAGYYAAKEKGFYDDVGLDVEIKERNIQYNNIEQVIDNEVQYSIADSVLMLYKDKGEPIVIVTPVFQHSASVLISLKSSGIYSPYDLDNKNMIFYQNDTDGFSILSMIKKLDVNPNIIKKREKNDYLKLINKDIDLFPAYLSNEPFYFKEKNIAINTFNPANYGFDLYGDMLFTNKNELENHPKRVEKFKKASLKGWEYALNNQEEIIQLIHEKYHSNKSIKHLRYEAKVIEKLISKDTVPLGTIEKGRLKYISNLYQEYGLAKNKLDIKDFIFDNESDDKYKINLTQEEKTYLKNHPILKVQNLKASPPFNFNENNKALGYTVDYMKLVAKTLDIKLNFISGKSWKEYLEMLKTGELDIIPQIAKNEERKNYISFTDFKHIDYQVSIAVRKSDSIKSFSDLKDKTISVLNKSFLHTLLKTKYPKQKLHLVPSNKEAIEAVANGKADAALGELSIFEYYKGRYWLSNITVLKIKDVPYIPSAAPMYIGVNKSNLILKSILDKTNKVLPYNEMLSLQKKWFNIDFKKNIPWTNEEISYLNNKKELKFCIDPNWLPFEKLKNGKHIGMTSDYISIFQKELPISLNLQISKNWKETIQFAKEKKCDFVTLMPKTNSRSKEFNFTVNIMKSPLVIATKQDKPFINELSSILSKKLGVIKGASFIKDLKKKYPTIKIVEVNNVYDGLSKVDKNELYGFIGILPVVGYYIQQDFPGNLKIDGKIDETISFSIASRKDEPLLNDILNKLINNISDQTHQKIEDKWISVKYEENVDYKALVYVVIIFIIILIVVAIKNRAINKINDKLSRYIKVIDENVLTSATNEEGIITDVSQAFCNISGYSKEELIGKDHSIVRDPNTSDEFYEEIWKTINSGKNWKGEIKNKKKNNSFYWVQASISPILDNNKNIIGYTSIRQDITDKKRIEEISITDELTTLFNKREFNKVFENEVHRAKRGNSAFAFIILDVDCFKLYNDFYGHQKGDYVLESVGKALKSVCQRASDVAFRIGGEEFGITFIPETKEDALKFAKLINKTIESLQIEHKYNKADSDVITVSIGVYTEIGKKLQTTKEIYNFADNAMYNAKETGRNKAILYES